MVPGIICDGLISPAHPSGSHLVLLHSGLVCCLCLPYVGMSTAARDLVYDIRQLSEWILIIT